MRISSSVTTITLAATLLVAPVVSLPSGARPVEPSVWALPLSVAAAQTSLARLVTPQEGAPEVLEVQDEETRPFDLVAVTWEPGPSEEPAPVVEVRLKEEAGWSEWTTLDAMDEGPDQGTAEYDAARTGTSPLLTDGAEGVEVRLTSQAGEAPQDARVELVDAGESAGDTSLEQAPLATAAAGAARPAIISRQSWGADESLRSGKPGYMSGASVGVVHHTASTNSYSAETAANQVRSIYAYHTRSLGWSDIGYNFLVDRYGRIYEGRAGGVDRAVQGAHTGGFNNGTFGVSALGNYEEATAPGAMTEAISQLVAWKLAVHGSDPAGTTVLTSAGGGTSKHSAGTQVRVNNLIGHRDVGSTSCPGQYLYGQLGAIRDRVVKLAGDVVAAAGAGNTDSVTGGYGSVGVSGWALRVGDATARTVVVKAGGADQASTRADRYRPDVAAAYRNNSANHGFAVTSPATPGVVAVCPRVEDSSGSFALPCRNTVVVGASPIGALDGVTASFGRVTVNGWTVDGDTTGPIEVHVYADGRPLGAGAADRPRPDVAAMLPGRSTGYSFSVPMAGGGTKNVCAYGISSGGKGDNALLGCRTVTAESSPRGSLDVAAGLGGAIDVKGWVIDADSPSSGVHVYVDGRFAGATSSTTGRPDVTAAYPAFAGHRPGWADTVLAGPGAHQVCAYGINSGSGGNRLLGCRAATVPTGAPFGAFDGFTGSGGSRAVRGWTIDPDVRGTVRLHVYVDGRFAGAGTTQQPRGDVLAAFPGYDVRRGFSVPIGSVSGRQACVYALDDSGRHTNTTLGCRNL